MTFVKDELSSFLWAKLRQYAVRLIFPSDEKSEETMWSRRFSIFAAASVLIVALAGPQPAGAGDCTGYIVGVRPLSQYNHANGNGFLAVRSGPGGKYRQVGELYSGDEISVYGRRGNWYEVTCMSGVCTNPLWGPAVPSGWVYGKYISIGGVCP